MATLPTPTGQIAVTDPILCEVCGKSTPLAQAHSMSVSYNMPGQDAKGVTYPAYQCPNLNHFACSHEHAVLAALMCIFEHIDQGNHPAKGKGWGALWKGVMKNAIEGVTITQGGS